MEVEQNIENKGSGKIKRTDGKSYNFWVASGPFFETNLFVTALSSSSVPVTCGIKIFDADGAIVNNITVQITNAKLELIELEPFMESCKMESGLKHASLHLTADFPVYAFCRIYSRDSAACFSNLISFSSQSKSFIPLNVGKDKTNLIALVNYGKEQAQVKCKIFLPKRSPEQSITIPAQGSRIFCVESEFSDLFDSSDNVQKEIELTKKIPAYLRLTSKNEMELGTMMIEKVEAQNGNPIYSVLAGAN